MAVPRAVQDLPRHGAAVARPAAAERIRDLVQTVVFYGLVALGIGTPIVLAGFAALTR